MFVSLSFRDILNPLIGFFLNPYYTSWAAPAVTKGCHLVALLKCSPAHLWQMLSWQISFLKSNLTKGSVKGVKKSIFGRMLSWSLKNALQYSLSKCFPHKMLFSWRAFFYESILPKNMGEHFWESKRAFLQNRLLPDSESLKILDIRLWEVGAKRLLKGTSKVKKWEKKKTFFCAAIFDNFKQKYSYLRPLLSITFPQGFRISKNIGHPTLGSGGQKDR